jgi:hypothetical protein
MTQNGPHPGQPWSAGGVGEPYQEPADPWGESDGWGGNPTSTPPGISGSPADYGMTGSGFVPGQQYTAPQTSMPGFPPTGMHPAPVWVPPAPGAGRRGPGAPIVALVVVLGLLICGGLGTTGYLLANQGDDKDPVASGTTTPAPAATTAVAADPDPEPQSSQDARFVTKGQCVRNEGTSDTPKMSIVPCGSGTYEVLARVEGRTTGEADAQAKCAKVRQYTKWYFYDSELDGLDFVLCLKER